MGRIGPEGYEKFCSIFPALIAAGAAIAGSAIAANQAEDEAGAQENLTREQMFSQREAAQHGISWRVRDAIQSGVHPLYAINANAPTITPVAHMSGGGSAGHYAQMGQDISRAITAASSNEERQNDQLAALALERAGLENDLLRAQIAKETAQIGPGVPSAVATPSDITMMPLTPPAMGQVKQPEVMASMMQGSNIEAGVHPETRFVKTPSGGWAPHPSKEIIQDQEITNPLFLEWLIRNRVLPTVAGSHWSHPLQATRNLGRVTGAYEWDPKIWNPPPRSVLERYYPGAVGWEWVRRDQAYHPVYPEGPRRERGGGMSVPIR